MESLQKEISEQAEIIEEKLISSDKNFNYSETKILVKTHKNRSLQLSTPQHFDKSGYFYQILQSYNIEKDLQKKTFLGEL